jgi:hypothetical protein
MMNNELRLILRISEALAKEEPEFAEATEETALSNAGMNEHLPKYKKGSKGAPMPLRLVKQDCWEYHASTGREDVVECVSSKKMSQ